MFSDQLIAFRADASLAIGTGHIMRCMTLADTLRHKGATTVFICRELPGSLASMLKEHGHAVIYLTNVDKNFIENDLEHASWLSVNQIFDARESIEKLQNKLPSWMIVDHYALDYRWENALLHRGINVAAIDDLADRAHSVNLFINQNIVHNADSVYSSLLPLDCKKLIGPDFALLRDEFLPPNQSPRVRTKLNEVLIFFGGSDPKNLTILAIESLKELLQANQCRFNVTVVIGDLHPAKEHIKTICNKYHFACHIQTQDMAALLSKADLTIGAGGSSCWERCALGLPSILISIAKNQTHIAEALAHHNAALYIGEDKQVTSSVLINAVTSVTNTKNLLQSLSQESLTICDGQGKYRIIESMQAIA